jgi:hypothetical protein
MSSSGNKNSNNELPAELLDLLATGEVQLVEYRSLLHILTNNLFVGFTEERTKGKSARRENCKCDVKRNPDCDHSDETEMKHAPEGLTTSGSPATKKQRVDETIVSFPQDIRREYSQMFIQTLNSGDVSQIQSFFKTYMTGSCKFAIQHQINQSYGLPQFLNSSGPDLFAHYLMGCFMMFPDMIIKLADAKVSVSSNWKGSRIVMETEIKGSKMRSIKNYPWLPAGDALTSLYENTTSAKGAFIVHSNNSAEILKAVKEENENHLAGVRSSSPGVRLINAYMNAVTEQSEVVAKPLQLRTRGSITLYLDENNCIKYMICSQASL